MLQFKCMLRLWKGFSGTSLPARQPQPLITLIAWSVPVINGGLCTQKTVWASDTKAGLALLYFWQNGFENCATGTDVANISFYAEGSLFFFFFKKYGLLCILHRGHWSCMDWKKLMQNEKETNKTKQKKKPAKCLPKNSNKWAVPVQFHSLCWVQL